MGESLRSRLGERIGIHEHGRLDPAPAEADAFAEVGDAQRIGAVGHEDGAHLGGAVAVAVGLDHGEDLPLRADEPAHRAHIRCRGIEVDLERGRTRRSHARLDDLRRQAAGSARARRT